MTGLDKARATAKKLKKEVVKEAKQASKETGIEVTVQGLKVGAEVAEFYRKNANVGSENISRDSLPGLKVTESNSDNILEDGSRAGVGKLFYTRTKEEFDSVEVSIVSVSRSYYSKGINVGDKPKFNQIVSGVIIDSMKPFVMYVSGKRLQGLWDFGKELAPFTKHKTAAVPMMAFKVKLSTSPVKHKFGTTHIINFEIVRDESKQIQLTIDLGVLELLRKGVDSMEEAVQSIIEATEVDKRTGELLRDRAVKEVELVESEEGVTEEEVEEALSGEDTEAETKAEDVNDDIPF